jgi:uncharacterized protein (DUF4415 family)
LFIPKEKREFALSLFVKQVKQKGDFIMAIAQYTTEQLKKMKSSTDWGRVRDMKNEDIDFSDAPDVSQLLSKGIVRRIGRPLKQDKKQAISIRLPISTVEKLRSSGKNWQTWLSDKMSQRTQ